jgi:oligopeptidase B
MDGFLYQWRISKGQQHRTYYRKPLAAADELPWQLVIDGNAMAQGKPYFELDSIDVSPDGNWLAYTVDFSGDEIYELRFRDLRTGKDLPQRIFPVASGGEWTSDSAAYLYLVDDDARRTYQIYHYRLHADPASTQLVHQEDDPLFFTGLYKSQDGKWLFAYATSKETNEVWLSAADDGTAFTPLLPRNEGIRNWPEHHNGNWLIHTNRGAPDFQLLSVRADSAEPIDIARASVLIPPREGVRLRDILPLRDHLVLTERADGLDQFRIHVFATGEQWTIPFPEQVYALHEGMNAEFDTTVFDFTYSSPIRPQTVYRHDLTSRTNTVRDVSTVPSGHSPEAYTVYRIHATSADGTAVPMTIVHRKDAVMDGSRPAYLYGYGSYGETIEPAFIRSWLTWLQRDFTVAIAHVRGSGLLGEQWYQDGKLLNKPNSFDDFVACAEALIEHGYTSPQQLVIEGGSAGGLLVGAVLNMRPELFGAALAAVPFVDVLTTMFDTSLPLTTFEFEEWGDPRDPAFYQVIASYSPVDNVRALPYPAILATAGLNDPRVPYWEAAKWIAKLRLHSTSSQPLLLKTNLDSGHSGASGRYDYLRETAFEQAFLLHMLGLP